MDAVEYILDGLEAALQLERELGVVAVDFDRSLLAVSSPRPQIPPAESVQPTRADVASSTPAAPASAVHASHASATPAPATPAHAVSPVPAAATAVAPAAPHPSVPASAPSNGEAPFDFVFLHDRPLGEKGQALLLGIINAMKKTPQTAPLVISGAAVPAAKVYVVLGQNALRSRFPGVKASPGQWIKTRLGRDALVTYSPEYVVRFSSMESTLKHLKFEMWQALKGVLQRVKMTK